MYYKIFHHFCLPCLFFKYICIYIQKRINQYRFCSIHSNGDRDKQTNETSEERNKTKQGTKQGSANRTAIAIAMSFSNNIGNDGNNSNNQDAGISTSKMELANIISAILDKRQTILARMKLQEFATSHKGKTEINNLLQTDYELGSCAMALLSNTNEADAAVLFDRNCLLQYINSSKNYNVILTEDEMLKDLVFGHSSFEEFVNKNIHNPKRGWI